MKDLAEGNLDRKMDNAQKILYITMMTKWNMGRKLHQQSRVKNKYNGHIKYKNQTIKNNFFFD
jgi:hypothetical protein